MTLSPGTAIALTRDTSAIQIPFGDRTLLPEGTMVYVSQTLGGAFTVNVPAYGGLYRIDGRDSDALGLGPASGEAAAPRAEARETGPVDEEKVWAVLRSCYDPEIPVNIVELGLVYDLAVAPVAAGGHRVDVKMTLTAPGCGMGPAIAADARQKILAVPGVAEADVALVWDPPWNAEMMSPEAKKTLGVG